MTLKYPIGPDEVAGLERLGAEIRRLRLEAGFKIAELADSNSSFVMRIERGSRRARLDTLRAIAAALASRGVGTTGDGFIATFDATGRALRCATDILISAKDIGLELRAGVHAGEVEVRGDDIAGLAVTIAKRVCDLAEPGQLLVSETVRGHTVGAGIQFQDQGEQELKGVPGTWKLYRTVP
jgi:class 3 adenylate cyclase